MVFTGFFDEEAPYPDELLPRLAALGDRVLFGSDFPTIPYPYLEQLEGLRRLAERHPGLGEEWLRRVCWHNAVELWGEPGSGLLAPVVHTAGREVEVAQLHRQGCAVVRARPGEVLAAVLDAITRRP